MTDRDGDETTVKDCFTNGDRRLEDVSLIEKQVAKRLDRLLLVAVIAISRAISTGLRDARTHALAADNKPTANSPPESMALACPGSQEASTA